MGYVGSTLTQYLKKKYPNIKLIGYDTSFFAHSLTGADFIDINSGVEAEPGEKTITLIEEIISLIHK